MTVKLIPLTALYPDSGYDTNRARAPALAQAAIEYFRACHAVVERRDDMGASFHVELPLMHLTLELLLKAFAAKCDVAFRERRYSHQSSKIVRDYADRVPVCAALLADPARMALLDSLERAWTTVRYAETYVEYEGSDWAMFNEMTLALADAYNTATSMPLLAHHYRKRLEVYEHRRQDAGEP